MPVTIRDRDMRIVSTSRNLRGILGFSRTHVVERIDIWPGAAGGAQLGITWMDGASCITDFASFTLCKDWVSRRRVFFGAQVVVHATAKAAA
jgi:hypothetical protein